LISLCRDQTYMYFSGLFTLSTLADGWVSIEEYPPNI
jgi:hypothetical protein